MKFVEYATPFAIYNPGFTGVGWNSTFGASASHSDYSNNTGVLSNDLSGKSTYEHILTSDDSAIPSRAQIYSVKVKYTLGQSDIVPQGGLEVTPYIRYENGPPVYYSPQRPSYVASFSDFTAEFLRDPNGLPWSRDSIFRLKGRRLLFGLRSLIPDPWFQTARLMWSECRFGVNFTPPAPLVTTGNGVSLAPTTAQLAGTVDPRSATAQVPCRWWAEYGPASKVGYDHITAGTYITGDGVQAVLVGISGLTTGTQYRFRIAAAADGEPVVYGAESDFGTI